MAIHDMAASLRMEKLGQLLDHLQCTENTCLYEQPMPESSSDSMKPAS